MLTEVSRGPPPPLPGGYTVGEQIYFTGTSQTFERGDRLEHGKQGEVVGPATSESLRGKGVDVRFHGNMDLVSCYPTQVSREPPPPLPGGYTVGEQIYFTGAGQTVEGDCRLEYGKQGEVVGPATSESLRGKGVDVRFHGNVGLVSCYPTQVSREPPPPLPGGYTAGERIYYTGTSGTVDGGDRVEHGKQGEVVGPATSESFRGKGVDVSFPGNKRVISCWLISVSREPPPPTAKKLAAQQKEKERQAKERAREACQQQLAAAIEAGELEALREAIDAADLAGCSAPLLKQARGRRDGLRKAARRLERQAAAAQGDEEARRQRERQAAEAAAEDEKARAEAATERAAARQAAARAEEKQAAAAKAAQAEGVRRHRLLKEQEVAERKAKQEAAEEAARLAVAERARKCGSQQVQSAATGGDAVGAVAHLLGQASLQVPAGSSDAGAAAPVAAVAALDRPPSLPVAVTSLADAQFDTGRPEVPESTIGGQTTCTVCFVNPKSHAAVPCGHQCACGDCSAKMKECPICRNPAQMWMHVRVA